MQIPSQIHFAQDYERLAAEKLPGPSYAYIAGGSAHDLTVRANRDAFAAWSIMPRLLRDVSAGHTRTLVGCEEWLHPIGLAPVAYQRLAHPLAELETARAANAMDACLVASTLSSQRLEHIAAQAGAARWFQLYLQARQADTFDLLARAEAAAYRAIVLTLDASIQTASVRALRAGFQMPPEVVAENLRDYPAPQSQAAHPGSVIFQNVMRQAPQWADIDAILARSRVPVWVKGVLHPDDALALKSRGVAGLVVSNHGGRGLDGAPASLQALPAIRAAIGPDYPVLLDGGIRTGGDVFKALALGANAVLVGRLQMYALSVAGALGVAHMLKLLREEFEICMALAGCATVDQIAAHTLFSNPIHGSQDADHA